MFINLNIIKSYNKIIHCFCLQPDPSSMVPGPYPWLAMSQSMSSPISSSAPVSVHYWEWWWDIQPVDGLPTFHIWGDLIAGIDRWCFWSVTLTFISRRWTQKHWTNIGFINVAEKKTKKLVLRKNWLNWNVGLGHQKEIVKGRIN